MISRIYNTVQYGKIWFDIVQYPQQAGTPPQKKNKYNVKMRAFNQYKSRDDQLTTDVHQ